MRAVVTGGAGFIGSNLVDALLERGDEVLVVDNFATGKRHNLNGQAALLEHDIREQFEVEADVIFHLAAQAATVGRSGGPFNVGTGVDVTVAELLAACAQVAAVEAQPRFEAARLGDVRRSVLDVGRIERELGWRPRVSLDEGLQRTWAWMQDPART